MKKNFFSFNLKQGQQKSGVFKISQGPHGGVYIIMGTHFTLLHERQLLHLKIPLTSLPGFDLAKFKQFYTSMDRVSLEFAPTFGFFKDDKVVAEYKNHVIIDTNGVLQVVDPYKGTRFIIDLDDSKNCGYRLSAGMSYEEQMKAAYAYIDLIIDKMMETLSKL